MRRQVADTLGMPTEIVLHTKSKTLALAWPSSQLTIEMSVLREHCPCSTCEKNRIDGTPVIAGDVSPEITSVEPVGSYALNLVFSDGHGRGIYPWSYLKSLEAKPVQPGIIADIKGLGEST